MSDEAPFDIEAQMQQFARDHRITADTSSRLPFPPARCRRFMETTRASKSSQGRPSIVHVQRNHRSCSWKVKKRSRLARHLPGQAPSNVHAPRNHHRRVWKVKRRLKLAYRHHHHIHGDHASSEARGQELISPPPLLHVMKYMVPLVLVLVTLKYQAKTENLFSQNPAPVWCFVAATGIYWVVVGAMKQMTAVDGKRFQKLSRAALAFGVLSIISLASIFLPSPVSLLPVTVLVSFPVVLALPYACNLFLRGIKSIVSVIHGILVWARSGSDLTKEASLPV